MQNPISRRACALGATVVALAAPVALALPASASASANEVVYTADDDRDGIYSVVLRDLESRRVTTVLPADTTEEWIYDDPELSPDGGRIAFSTDRGSASFDEGIAVVNRDGTGFRRLTTPPASTEPTGPYAIDVAAAWSPNGQTLLFTRITTDVRTSPATVTTALFTVPAAGGAAAAVPGGANGYTADWSPDGSRIVFAALPVDPDPTDDVVVENEVGAITVMALDGTGRTPLGPTGLMPAWSPDGSTVAFATITSRDSDRTRSEDVTQIATVPAAGGTSRNLAVTQPTAARTVAEYPAWTPDGESIVFDLFGYSSTVAFPPGDLWAVDRQGLRAGRVTTTAGDDTQAHVQGPAPSAVSAGAPSTYTPVTPRRILDTRAPGVGAPAAKIGPGATIDLAVRGVTTAQGPVPANASAVVLNLTVTGTTASTDVRAYPSGTPVPGASSVNAGAGQTVPNLVTVRIGDNGAITLRNSGGTVNLIGDIAGWYTPDAAGAGFAAVDPSRVLDTRSPAVSAPAAKVGPKGFVDLQVTGALPTADGTSVTVPADARAVVLNVTATGATSSTDVRVYPTPTDSSVPEVSNLNVRAGQTTPNLVTVAVGQGGKVRLRNLGGSVNLIADLAGYYASGATGRFVPVAPTRFLDTRSGVGAAPIPTTGSGVADLKVAGARGVPTGATAAVLNLTGTGVRASTDVRAYPFGAARVPTVSNLNLTAGATRANLVIVRVGADGRVRVRNGAGSVNLIGDLAGYMIG
ncbi:MAG: N-acetylmuramoyl-L-alanine amidase [Frankiales bacterium]|nr:N-acetylmuramoyl-L-alanine amidase [Frankiales bacterium]